MEGQIASLESVAVGAEVEVHSQMFQQMEAMEALVAAVAGLMVELGEMGALAVAEPLEQLRMGPVLLEEETLQMIEIDWRRIEQSSTTFRGIIPSRKHAVLEKSH